MQTQRGQQGADSVVHEHPQPTRSCLVQMTDSTARANEERLISRCSAVARGESGAAEDEREANVFRIAAVVIESKLPVETARLRSAAKRYFSEHGLRPLSVDEVFERGWIITLPRLRDALVRALS